MKILVIKGEIHCIESHIQDELDLISDGEITDHDGSLSVKPDGVFDKVIAYDDTQGILDGYVKNKTK